MTDLQQITFAVYPEAGASFDPFLVDAPSLDGNVDRAARRVYFSVMARLAQQGLDIDEFRVNVWDDAAQQDGALVGMGGIT